MNKILSLDIPIKTVSEFNVSEHWRVKHARHKKQKKVIWYEFSRVGTKIPLPCHVKLTRISPRMLDKEDNLPGAFKWIKDQIATQLNGIKAYGRADDDKRISWEYAQEKGGVRKHNIRIEIFTNV